MTSLFKIVSDITSKHGYRNVSDLTPTEIAVEVCLRTSSMLRLFMRVHLILLALIKL